MAQPTFDANSSVDLAGGGSTTSFSHTCGSGTGRVLYVVITFWTDPGKTGITQAAYNGVPMDPIVDTGPAPNNDHVRIFRLCGPATGTNTVLLSRDGYGSDDGFGRAHSVSFADADDKTPDCSRASVTGTSVNPAVTITSDSDQVVLDGLASDATSGTLTMVADSGRTEISNAAPNGEFSAISREMSPALSETMDWTRSTSLSWAMAAVSIRGQQPSVEEVLRVSRVDFPKKQLRRTDEGEVIVEEPIP